MTEELRLRIAIARHLGIEPLRRWRVFYDKDRQAGSMCLMSREDALHNLALTRAGDIRCGYIHEEYSEPEEYDEWETSETPRWPTDANAALQLVEHMRKEENGGWYWSSDNKEGDCFYAQFVSKAGAVFDVTADTFPLAICKSFAQANGLKY